MKRARDLHSIILVATRVQCSVKMIGFESLVITLSITSADYTSLKDKTQVALGIKIIDGRELKAMDVGTTIITLLMIYLANADQLAKHNTMMKALLVHNK